MSPSYKMGDGMQQQRWEFRRRDNDNDSSSDESKSSCEAAHKKNKLVSGLISIENDDATGTCRVRQTGMYKPRTEDQVVFQEGKRVHLRRSRKDNWTNNDMERDSCKEVSRKKSKTCVYDPAALDELKIFTESLLEDLKVKREHLLSWMRKEMQKLVGNDTAPSLERREKSSGGKNVRVEGGDNFEENTMSKENVQVQNNRKYEVDILIQHQNNFEKSVAAQHESNSGENVFAHSHNNFKETVQVQQQDNFEEVNFQINYPSNFESRMKAQQGDTRSLERSVKSNTPAGYDNCYHGNPNLQSSSTAKSVQLQHQMNYLSGTRAHPYSYGSLDTPLIGQKMAESNNRHLSIEHQVDCVQEIGSRTSSDKERGGRLGLHMESNFSSNLSGQAASSMYLTLPTVLSKFCGESHMLSTSSGNYIRTPFDRHRFDVNSGKENPMLKVSGYHGNLSGMQCEDRNGSFAPIGSGNVSRFDKQSIPSSSIRTGFPVPLHQAMDIGVNIPRQVSFDYLPREEKNIMGLRMDRGALRFSGGSYATSEDYLSNNFYSHSIGKAHGRLEAFQNQDLQEGHLFPK